MEFWPALSAALQRSGLSAAFVRQLEAQFGRLSAAELLDLPHDRLRPALPGPSERERQQQLATLLEVARAVRAQLPDGRPADGPRPPAPAPQPFAVSGQVRSADGGPAAGVTVRAFDRGVGRELLLAETRSDDGGRYALSFAPAAYATPGRASPHLLLRAFGDGGAALGASELVLNARSGMTIDLTVARASADPRPAREALLARLAPLLGQLDLADLDDDDAGVLAADAGIDPEQVAALRQCARLARETRLPAAFLFALAGQRLPLDAAKLLARSDAQIRRALEAAVEQRAIAAPPPGLVEEALARLEELRVERGLLIRHKVAGQLQDQSSGAALAGLTVRVEDLDARPAARERGVAVTDPEGAFSFAYTAAPRARGRRAFRLHILDRRGEELHTAEVSVPPGREQLDQPISVPLPTPGRPSHRLADLEDALRLEMAPELRAALERHKLATLEDLRRAGGMERLADPAISPDDPEVRRLQAHADLSLLSDDLELNDALIARGYDNFLAIARGTRRDFGKRTDGLLGAEEATKLHRAASAQALTLHNRLTGQRVARANRSAADPQAPAAALAAEPACTCRDCQSAVSPLAYLADLLAYATRHVQAGDEPITLAFLEQSLHQPFGAMPASCESAERPVRQVRLAVEVLRSVLDRTPFDGGLAQQVISANRRYCLAAYQALLLRAGTSYDELRLAQIGPPHERRALAERLAIARPEDDEAEQLIERLWLDQSAHYPDPQALSELNLERLFGLPSTYAQSRFCDGAKLGDAQDQITLWRLEGLAWRRNTDANGSIYVRLTKAGGTVQINLYRDESRQAGALVASGSRLGDEGPIVCVEENFSGLSGSFSVRYRANTTTIVIAALPAVLSWRLAALRRRWLAERGPPVPEALDAEPVVDPDLIGPDDLRHPAPGQPAFDLWLARRAWVDDRLRELRSQTRTSPGGQPVPDVAKLLGAMAARLPAWQTLTGADLLALDRQLHQAPGLDATAMDQVGALLLTAQSLRRLAELVAKDSRWEDGAGEAVSGDEWEELYSVLVQAQKRAVAAAWRAEEQAISSTLRSPEHFWPALREPATGPWPPLPIPGRPWIDPDTLTEADLPDAVVGDRARDLLRERREELAALSEQLDATREAHGLEALLAEALGPAPAGSSWEAELGRLHDERLSSDAARAEAARARIAGELRLTEGEFDHLLTVTLQDRAARAGGAQAVRPETWAALAATLTRVAKERVKHPQWTAEEDGLAYWSWRKARLPPWRATAASRQAWQQALRTTAEPPTVDPDLLDIPDFVTPFAADDAFRLWQERGPELAALRASMASAAGATHLERIDGLLAAHLGLDAGRLDALAQEERSGLLADARLQQLDVSRAGLGFVLRVRALAAEATAPAIGVDEWETVYDILIQVAKRRRLFPRWRAEEAGLGLTVSPDHFRPRAAAEAPAGRAPNPWRAAPADRRDWERTLEARIAQQESLAQALLDALGAAEEATLPGLRADLIAALSGPDKPPDIAGAELGERLLIDMANSGCQLTTRASQAIVTVQQLLWSLRAGRLKDPWPTLSLDAEQFDAEWAWLGSYATWRAAMLVFLYPENVLLPSLRPRQTPAFRRLVARVSAAGPVRPEEACDLANEYAAYFADVCNLSLKATCSADYVAPGGAARCSPAERESAPRKRSGLFLFAQSKLSGSVYLSTLDPGQQAAHAQSYWERVPGLEAFHSSDIIGAVSYEVSESESYIYLFLRVAEAAQGKLKYELAYLKYDLNKAVEPWDDEITRLEIKTRPTPAGVAQSVTASQLSPWAAVLCQNRSRHKPPLLSIQLDSASPKAIYCNTLDSAGKGLAHEYWLQWPALRSQVETTGGRWRFRDGKYYQLVGLCEHQVQRGGAAPLTGHILLFQQAFPSEGAWLAGFEPTVTNRIAAFCDVAAPKGYQDVTQEDPDAALYRQNFALETLGASDYSSKSHRFAGMRAGLPRGDVWAFVKEERSNAYEYVTLGFTMREPAAGAAPGAITDGRFYHALSAVPVNPSHLLGTVAVHGGTFGGAEIPIAVHRADAEGGARPRNGLFLVQCAQNPATGYVLGASISATRIAPHVLQDDPVAEGWARLTPLTDDQRGTRRAFTTLALWYSYGNDLLHYNQSASTVARDYVEEAYFALPLFIARTLARHQLFTHALDWFRNVYDHTAPQSGDRKIWRGLTQEEGYGHSYMREDQWLADPIDPHRIVRAHTRTKFVVLSIVQTLLAYADAEYSLDTAEAHARARSLYAQARELLDLPELGQGPDQCAQELGELVVHLRALPQIAPGDVARLAGRLNGAALGRLATTVRSILAADEGQATKAERVRALLHATGRDAADPWTLAQQLDRSYLADVKAQRVLLAGAGLALTDRAPSVAPGSGPPMTWLPSSFAFCVPPNPVVAALRFHAELNLYKLRTCRNIAGMERELDPYGAPTGATSGLPAIGAGGRLILPGATSIQPTQYRYATLVERARQLAGLAQQMEASMLAALEKGDAERYHLLKARQDARLTRAGVRLQDLRVQEAERGVALVELQRERASIQFEHFDGLIGAGLLGQEWWAAALLWTNVALQFSVGAIATGGAVAAGLVAGGVLGAKSGPGALVTALAGGGSAAALAMSLSQTAYSSITGGIATTSSALSLWAGFERRRQEWELQRSLAEQDGRIGDQQILLARDRVWITGQEREIARIQADHADDVTEFLSTKFTSAELYDWMSGVMEGVYRYFLRQATGVARLAEHQLAFERQELPPAFIQADYWDAPRDAAAAPDGDGGPDRRGLTGSARLLQDLYRLDQHAFETDRRKLQLTRTISLARLDPFAFQLLRERGVMVFATPMELFDRDFPGHYLRLIRRVRTSVIALVPPVEGLKATLATTGISRVVVGGDLFQTTVVNRGPESVALTSPQNATGLFELEAQGQGGMLLPFEGLGVDTTWELRIPAPANAFDFRTIADVLVTIEYTALDSPLYRRQVIERLDRRVSADRPFSFRHQFADAWYDLHNPDLTATPLEVAFTTRREDFPPNVEALTIEHVTLYVARGPGVSAEVAIRHLRFAPQGGEGEAGGPATTAGGAASTRQGNGGTWLAMVGKPPVGAWTLALEDTPEVRGLLKSGQVEDILLVITCGGQTAEWPA